MTVATKTMFTLNPESNGRLSITELSVLYDRIYNIADRLFRKHNPCNIHFEDGIVCCTGYPDRKRGKFCQKYGSFLCCNKQCSGFSENGCTIKCLACKLYICHNKYTNAFIEKLYIIKRIAEKYDLPVWKFFLSKEDWLEEIIIK